MTIDYCSKETTKLLLEKGYPLDKLPVGNWVKEYAPIFYTLPYDNPDWVDCDAYFIPTQAEVLKWLREEHHFIIVIQPNSFSGEECTSWYYDLWVGDNYEGETASFKSYQLATDSAIKYILENLI